MWQFLKIIKCFVTYTFELHIYILTENKDYYIQNNKLKQKNVLGEMALMHFLSYCQFWSSIIVISAQDLFKALF